LLVLWKTKFLGCILFKYESDGKLSDAINDISIRRTCLSRLCNPKYAGYISTIGVIDEIRGIGVGKNLLTKAISIMKMRKSCRGIYLHVIRHNKSAINFYTSNEFCRGKYFENFYCLQKNYYDCIVFYKLFEHKIDAKNFYKSNEMTDKIKYYIISNIEDK
jgi:ribosomal protein S18 acetylase RimI-like enzyme